MTASRPDRKKLKIPLNRLGPALVVAFLCLIVTAGAAFLAQRDVYDREQTLFFRFLEGLSAGTMRAAQSYEQRLLGLVGFVASNKTLTLEEWATYIAIIQSQELRPEIWDVGLFDRLPPEQSVVARYITLFSGKTIEASSGRNAYDNIESGSAIRRALETGKASLTEVVRNAYSPNIAPAYAMIAPVLEQPLSEPESAKNLIFISFSAGELLDAIIREIEFPICVTLHDGNTISAQSKVSQICRDGATTETAFYTGTRTVMMAGRPLTLFITADRGFYIAPLALPVSMIVVLGTVIATLLGGILWLEATTRERAISLAASITADLEQSRNRYDRAVRVAGVGFWERDHNTKQVIWSEKMWDITGYDRNTVLDTENLLREIAHPDDKARVDLAASEHRKNGTPFEEEYRILRPDGQIVWIRASADTDRGPDKQPIRTVGSITDITPQKKEEETRQSKEQELTETINELRQSQERLDAALRDAEAASRAKSTFLSTMSHELRTPLNAILGFSEVIRDNLLGRESRRSYEDYAADIHSSGEHLLDLINDILDLAKVEEGQITLNPEDVDLNSVIDSTLNLMQPRAIGKRQALSARFEHEHMTIYADLRALKQVLFNLIANAVQFTHIGGKIDVSATTLRAGNGKGNVEICVKDNGIGIAKTDIGRIFNPFERVIEPGQPQSEGTGLGLAVVKSLIELHGGSLRVDSTPGAGSTFCITFQSRPPPFDELRNV